MKFSDSFLDEIRGRLPVSQVVSRRVPLKRAGREWKGLSPFNREKTPSFTVNDQKGFYHCFSSGKHGDIFTFLMETEGLSFPEAVERLAGEAGLPLPKPDPQYERVAKERLSLLDALEAAAKLFEEALQSAAGREALTYAEGRGLARETLQEFRIGHAPSSRDALKSALIKQGFTEVQLLDAGLLIKPDDGRPTYDRFRNRLTIPILDAKSRVVAFGARALDPQAEPKYLNSPETRLFDKGSTVFNFARARGPAFDRGELIVVEGYMDVIALHQVGFANVAATLGTAFTERQMEILWQLAPEPVICFDGDRAGEAAAARAIDRMLPALREGHSFRFAFLPQGQDPDDLVRSAGPAAFAACVGGARPLIDILWLREKQAARLDTPERRAAFEARLETLLGQITNARVRDHYRREIKNRLFALWREQPRPRQGERAPRVKPRTPAPREKLPPPSVYGFAAIVTLALVNHPWLLDHFAEEVASVEVRDKPLASLLAAVTSAIFEDDLITRERLVARLSEGRHGALFERLMRESPYARVAFLQPETPSDQVEAQFADVIYRWRALPTLNKELAESADQLADMSEAEFERFAALQQQVASVGQHHEADDAGERDANKRFAETVARLKAEHLKRGRRPEKRH
ncbi:MAG: DNA primase [Methyloceanibacter sp.]|uniref:DNA primase n=1 Tax=Methyloceanibacter sp. TaxID=1965321 RepID=UPI003D6D6292